MNIYQARERLEKILEVFSPYEGREVKKLGKRVEQELTDAVYNGIPAKDDLWRVSPSEVTARRGNRKRGAQVIYLERTREELKRVKALIDDAETLSQMPEFQNYLRWIERAVQAAHAVNLAFGRTNACQTAHDIGLVSVELRENGQYDPL